MTHPEAVRARADWNARIGRRRDSRNGDRTVLPPPARLDAVTGRGHVTLDWDPVPGAVGYLVHRSESGDGPFLPLDHGGGDVLAVPHPPYLDTTGQLGRIYHYAVATLTDVDRPGPLGQAVPAASHGRMRLAGPDGLAGGTDSDGTVRVVVDAARTAGPLSRPWQPMIGSEHLSHLLSEDRTGGRSIGRELAEALRTMHTELGVRHVRAHGILCDDLGVYREVDGQPWHDFSRVVAVYDRVLDLGLRPVVELSFMPHDLARDPSRTVFGYRAIVSPPKDWDRWADLVRDLVAHLVDRFGLDEVRHWDFEVWNEANLEVFWSGTKAEYLRLYEVTARAVKDVDPSLAVGGPGSAAAAWNGDLLEYVTGNGVPIDFLSTHTYGSPPLDLRPLCVRYGLERLRLLWTEWGITPTHFNPVSDGVLAATFLLRGMRSAAGRLDALAYWVASDHFEELGRPPALFHGGFGLLTVGNLRKPRYWALDALNRLGREEVAVGLTGDGAGSLVEAWAGRDPDGRVCVLVWNGTLDQSKADGAPILDRDVTLRISGLTSRRYRMRHLRVDHDHSNIQAAWQRLGGGAWPDNGQWAALRAADRFESYEPDRPVEPDGGLVEHRFPLPMPGVTLLELVPADVT
ncbi:MAG TPA: xylan 1,4-beta-xylosidase [Micromonosporaceae bacterium]